MTTIPLPFRFAKACIVCLSILIVSLFNMILFYLLPPAQHRAMFGPLYRNGGFTQTEVSIDDLRKDLGSWSSVLSLIKMVLDEVRLGWVSIGEQVPHLPLLQLHPDGSTSQVSLNQFVLDGRPLVVNIGCSTWPPFMRAIEHFSKMALSPLSEISDFLCVYIREMHPIDEWKLSSNNYQITQPKTIEERLDAASQLHKFSLPFPLLVDGMDNKLCTLLQGTPERLLVIHNGKLIFGTERGPYNHIAALEHVEKLVKQITTGT